MTTSKKEKKIVEEELTIDDNKLPIIKNEEEDTTFQQFSNATDALMPELEELVKKNPNRLIGCGG
ncbi:MAG: hypothetical protein KA174_06575 [Chitinophagales bacterium]|jgi:hypothetical protein|nr:hypothetical protein [Chitinophagales bacterium]